MSKPYAEAPARSPAAGWPSAREWWSALRWVALVYTLLVALALAGSFFPYERVVAEGHPWLPDFHCAGCPLCGMTRAFCALSAGRWREAAGWNRGAPALYAGFWLWLAAAALVFARAARSGRRGRPRPSA